MNLKSFRNPDLYHGRMGKSYFEGWYFKLVNPEMTNTFAFIPGIFYSPDQGYSHAFIQIVDGTNKTYVYERFAANEFWADSQIFSVTVAGNHFGRAGISLSLNRPEAAITGKVNFTGHLVWPDNFINPGSMGFYNYIPRMQCYSQVCAMDFDLEGKLNISGQEIDFRGGKGYIEKNWGSAFPYSWVWIQCNHFQKERASLSCSLGHIPFLMTSFKGSLIGLYIGKTFYEFTTMNRSKIEVIQQGTDIALHLSNKHYKLTVACETKSEDFILLNGPRGKQMVPLVQENLQGIVHIELKDISSGNVLFSDTGCGGGVEYGGEQMLVLDR